jgi:site-specific DNA recombinase
VPLGYDVRDRKLMVNEVEATTAKRIFEGFAGVGSGTKLAKLLQSEGVTTTRGKPINKAESTS